MSKQEKDIIASGNVPLACTLTPEELRARGEELHELFAHSQQVQELSNGYAFQYPCEKAWIDKLTSFIVEERECCHFFTFELLFEPAQGPLWLRIYGREGVKDILREEFRV